MTDKTIKLTVINTDGFSTALRAKAINVSERRLLITRFTGSKQERDLTAPANCKGLGRVRHFRRQTSEGWPTNTLPIDPASHALKVPSTAMLRAQVFQNAVCNWRCWYCFVDFELLSGNEKHSQWVTADELVDLYFAEPDSPSMIDLTGGQPDLTPEWIPWMMDALEARGLRDRVYLWSDDNLSNDYFWRFLGEQTRARIAEYPMYGRVCCFKGYDRDSFAFNTMAAPALFDRQFELMRRLAELGIDLYAYVTLTAPDTTNVASGVQSFVDRLQKIDKNLPLRTIPLEIKAFTPVLPRLNPERRRSIECQQVAISYWRSEMLKRFSEEERRSPIWAVPTKYRGARA